MPKKIVSISTLSVIQPWADLIIKGTKNVENRSKRTRKRGFIAIHASQKKDLDRFEICKELYKVNIKSDKVSYGSIIGFIEIVDCIDENLVTKKTKKWFQGTYGYILENAIILKETLKIKGSRGFWKLTGKDLHKCLSQIPLKNRKGLLNKIA